MKPIIDLVLKFREIGFPLKIEFLIAYRNTNETWQRHPSKGMCEKESPLFQVKRLESQQTSPSEVEQT